MHSYQRWLSLVFSVILVLMAFPGMVFGESTSETPAETVEAEIKEAVSTVHLSVTDDAGKVMLPQTPIEVEAGDTAFTILLKTLGSEVDYIGSGSTLYVRAIGGLAEFDRGPLSGWMYRVNGMFPPYSAGIYKVYDGDRVEWVYTTDGGKDVGFSASSGAKEGNNQLREAIPPKLSEERSESISVEKKGQQSSARRVPAREQRISHLTTQKIDLTQVLNDLANWVRVHHYSGEWAALGLFKATGSVPDNYLEATAELLQKNQGEFRKVTDYERLVLGIRAASGDPRNIAGYDLIEKIYNNERMTLQGSNGVIFALIALDSSRYPVPDDALWTREKLLNWLLENQNSDGSWALVSGYTGDVDVTAMALAALAPYESDAVKRARKKGFQWLSSQQTDNGGFRSWGVETSESASQVIIALTSNGIDPTSAAFTKQGGNLLENLLSYRQADGGFAHVHGGGSDGMANEQALLALASYQNYVSGKPRLYDLGDIRSPMDPKPDPDPDPDPNLNPKPKPDEKNHPDETTKFPVDHSGTKFPVYRGPFMENRLSESRFFLTSTVNTPMNRLSNPACKQEMLMASGGQSSPKEGTQPTSAVATSATGKMNAVPADSLPQQGYIMTLTGILCALVGVSFYLYGRKRGWR